MPYCPECGENVEESQKFCSNCGKTLEKNNKKSTNSKKKTEKKWKKKKSSSTNSSGSGSSGKALVVGGLLITFLVLAAAAPVVPAEETYTVEEPVETTVTQEVRLDYQKVNFEVQEDAWSGLTGGLTGTTDITYSLRNTDNEGGSFEATFECTGSDTTVTLSDEAYVQAGEVGELTASTEESIERCSANLQVPTKTVERTKTVMKERTKTRETKMTALEAMVSS